MNGLDILNIANLIIFKKNFIITFPYQKFFFNKFNKTIKRKKQNNNETIKINFSLLYTNSPIQRYLEIELVDGCSFNDSFFAFNNP